MKKALRSKWPRVRKILHLGKERYLVDARPHGRRELWDNPADAVAAAERIAQQRAEDGATSFAELSPSDRRDAAEALAVLEGQCSLLDAARAFVRESERQRALAVVPTVSEAIGQYLSAKRGEIDKGEFSQLSYYELTSRMRIVGRTFGTRSVADIDEGSVEAFVRELPHRPQGKRNILTKFSQFLNYAIRQKWIAANPAANIKVRVKQHDVEILDVATVRRLLMTAASAEPTTGVSAFICVQAFAGLRPYEAAKLRWEFIHFETCQIEVKAATSKTRQTRFVTMEPLLVESLLPYRKLHGPILGPRFEQTLREVKTAAGLMPWIPDVLRHCYGSYWLAVHHDRARLAELMGNSLSVIKMHYRRAIPEATAREYWTLPDAKIVEFKQPAA